MTLTSQEIIWAEMVLQNTQEKFCTFDDWCESIKIKTALNVSNQMREKFTQAQFDYKYKGFDMKAANDHLIKLIRTY